VANKADLASEGALKPGSQPGIVVSAKTGQGLEGVIGELGRRAAEGSEDRGASPITRTRHRVELVSVRDALKRFVNHDLDAELRAEELRIAAHHLGRLTGRIDVEDILGAIFSEFCIGK
jgi:tRNA modification GTPase